MTAAGLRDEVTTLLRELIRVDTVNPPGNETAAAGLLRAYLEDSGVACELYESAPGRGSLVARLPGGAGPRLLLLSHLDTVHADRAEWSVDPWSGELRDGCVWGRGALDMKGQAAASAVAIASLARDGFRPAGELLFAATADEESDTDLGLSWLCREHPEAIRCDYAINEGAGDRVELAGRAVYLCSTAEKASSPFRLRLRGRSGHASMPGIADNALVRAAPLVERLDAYRPARRVEPEVEALVAAITGGEVPPAERLLEVARGVDPRLSEILEPLLALTISPTMIEASKLRNVIPAVCEVVCDCRLLPGQTQAEIEPLLRHVLGEGDYELEWIELRGGTRSPLRGPLWEAVESFVAAAEPGAVAAPILVAGFTDSHYLREAFGTVAYGFFPMRTMSPELAARLIHSADERVVVDDLELGLDFLRHAARAVLGPRQAAWQAPP